MSNPKGIFKRETAGSFSEMEQVEVERGRIQFFSDTIGDTNPVHRDRGAAVAAGYPAVVAPPTFAVVINAIANEHAARAGRVSVHERLGSDMRYLLHGEESYTYHGPIFAGDTVEVQGEVLGFEDKKGGALELARMVIHIRHPERGPLVDITRTLIHRLG
jgi:acyl dehydratase